MSVFRPFSTLTLMLAMSVSAQAQSVPQRSASLISATVISKIREFVEAPVVWKSIMAQNKRLDWIPQSEVDRLDQDWVAERESDDQPLIASVLTNPLSNYLIRIQAGSLGLYTEIFGMDSQGPERRHLGLLAGRRGEVPEDVSRRRRRRLRRRGGI